MSVECIVTEVRVIMTLNSQICPVFPKMAALCAKVMKLPDSSLQHPCKIHQHVMFRLAPWLLGYREMNTISLC
jgi:hypothetical protein